MYNNILAGIAIPMDRERDRYVYGIEIYTNVYGTVSLSGNIPYI